MGVARASRFPPFPVRSGVQAAVRAAWRAEEREGRTAAGREAGSTGQDKAGMEGWRGAGAGCPPKRGFAKGQGQGAGGGGLPSCPGGTRCRMAGKAAGRDAAEKSAIHEKGRIPAEGYGQWEECDIRGTPVLHVSEKDMKRSLIWLSYPAYMMQDLCQMRNNK